jgi:hypothetical protein
MSAHQETAHRTPHYPGSPRLIRATKGGCPYLSLLRPEANVGGSFRIAMRQRLVSNAAARSRCFRAFTKRRPDPAISSRLKLRKKLCSAQSAQRSSKKPGMAC